MCFNFIIVEKRPSKVEYKVTLKTTVSGAWEKIGNIIGEHTNDCKFTSGDEQEEINKILDAVINFLEDFLENYENDNCKDNCECCDIYACQEDIKSILDLTNLYEIDKVNEVVEMTIFDGHI